MAIAEIDKSGGVPLSAASANALDRHAAVAFYPLLVAFGAAIWWVSQYRASIVPVWGPWDFSWAWFLATGLALWWYGLGLVRTPKAERPRFWRRLSYVAGVLSIYAVLQTHFEYLAEHMFFLNRVQHDVMHHIGPFLIALAWPGDTISRGMPRPLRRLVEIPLLVRVVRILQQPVLASILFVGLVGFWLIPSVHFRAMIDPKLYQVMNWSMVVDGVLFWTVVLDPRPKALARVSFGGRVAMALAVVPPQLVLGAVIALTPHDIYSFYAWCGRIYPSIGALADQQLGGANIWIPPSMMSGVALLIAMNALRLADEEAERTAAAEDDGNAVISAASWTG